MSSPSPRYLWVLLEQKMEAPLTYLLPQGCPFPEKGRRVLVPLRNQEVTGLALGPAPPPDPKWKEKIRPICRLLPIEESLPPTLVDLLEWVSQYYCASLGMTVRMALPAGLRRAEPIQPRQSENPLDQIPYLPSPPKTLSTEQYQAWIEIDAALEKGTFAPFLIHGVTGSGKTELYLRAIERALEKEKTILFLVPEISLTGQTWERLRSRIAAPLALLHHRLSEGERTELWRQIRRGIIRVAIGARSALFSPCEQVGLIIVDEEHEGAYKQSDARPTYHARDVAVMRAKMEGATLLLGSATPSLESFANTKRGKYRLLTLPTRADQATLPTVRVVDMKAATEVSKSPLFSQELLDGIEQRLEQREQTLLFLNRRGYYSSLFCTDCRSSIECPHCDLALTFHRKEDLLTCHLCSYQQPPPARCPSCKQGTPLRFRGMGTEQVERALHAIFPKVRTLRVDRDTTQRKGACERLLQQFRTGKADILVGTQMVAKGLHFPQVTLVGVLNADQALHLPDFRSGEQVFQLLTQVAGRAGRGELAGEVIIQSWVPNHPTISAAKGQDYLSFYQREIEGRRLCRFPPFCHLVKIMVKGKDPLAVEREAEALQRELSSLLPSMVELLPVTPAGYPKIRDTYRFQFLLRTTNLRPLQPILKELDQRKSTSLAIDVDPLQTYL